MTYSQATVIWNRLRQGSEGWLDAQARIESQRALTPAEAQAADLLWVEFGEALKRLARVAAEPRHALESAG